MPIGVSGPGAERHARRAGHSAVPSDTIPGREAPDRIGRLNVPAQFRNWHCECLSLAIVAERAQIPPKPWRSDRAPGPQTPVDEEPSHDDD